MYIGEIIMEINLVLRTNPVSRYCSGGYKISFRIGHHEHRYCGCLKPVLSINKL